MENKVEMNDELFTVKISEIIPIFFFYSSCRATRHALFLCEIIICYTAEMTAQTVSYISPFVTCDNLYDPLPEVGGKNKYTCPPSSLLRHFTAQFPNFLPQRSASYFAAVLPHWLLGDFNKIFDQVIFKLILLTDGWGISSDFALRWISLNDKSTLVQVMTWCRQAWTHHMSQCWPWSVALLGHNEVIGSFWSPTILGRELGPSGVSLNQRSRWKHAFSLLKHV